MQSSIQRFIFFFGALTLIVWFSLFAHNAITVNDVLSNQSTGEVQLKSGDVSPLDATKSKTTNTAPVDTDKNLDAAQLIPQKPAPISAPLAIKNTTQHIEEHYPNLPGALSIQNEVSVVATSTPAASAPTSIQGALQSESIRIETNKERATNGGLHPLRSSSVLTKIAEAKARDLLEKQYFAHVSPTGVDIEMLAKTHAYEYLNIGENLALGNFKSSEHVVTAWMNSPGHRANILNTQYTEIGISAIEGIYEENEVWFVVQEFGRPQSDCPLPDELLKQKISIYTVQLSELEKTLNRINEEISQPGIDAKTHNSLAKEYNIIVALYNSLVVTSKSAIADFNLQADAYNSCIAPP